MKETPFGVLYKKVPTIQLLYHMVWHLAVLELQDEEGQDKDGGDEKNWLDCCVRAYILKWDNLVCPRWLWRWRDGDADDEQIRW